MKDLAVVEDKWSWEQWENEPELRWNAQWSKESLDHSYNGYYRNTLHCHAFMSRIAQNVPLFKPANVQTHLKFSRDHLEDPEEDWGNVMRSEETIMELFGMNAT